MYSANIITVQKTYGSFFGNITRAILQKLEIQEDSCAWLDNTTKPIVSQPYRNITDVIDRSTGAAIIILNKKLYHGKKDKRFIVIEFSDFPVLSQMVSNFPECIGCMAVERHDQLLPSSDYPKIESGYFSRNFLYIPDKDLFDLSLEYPPKFSYTGTIDQLFFGGAIQPNSTQRQVLSILRDHPDVKCILSERVQLTDTEKNRLMSSGVPEYRVNNMFRSIRPYTIDGYLQVAAQYKALLALEGTSGFCNREFDILHMGAPLIMPPWRFSHKMEPLVDNLHYLAVDFDTNLHIFAENILKRFNEVRYDERKRDFIRLNGQQWYLRNCTIPKITENIVQWIENAFENSTPITES